MMQKFKAFLKSLSLVQIFLYVALMAADIYILGCVDFIEHKLLGVAFVVLNACLITLIRYGGKKN